MMFFHLKLYVISLFCIFLIKKAKLSEIRVLEIISILAIFYLRIELYSTPTEVSVLKTAVFLTLNAQC
jgi:hypothetical protein